MTAAGSNKPATSVMDALAGGSDALGTAAAASATDALENGDDASTALDALDSDDDASTALNSILKALQVHDAAARIERKADAPRHCTTAACLCGREAVVDGHRYAFGHCDLARGDVDANRVAERIRAAACSCCKAARKAAKRAAAAPPRRCHGCGATDHVARDCSMGRTASRRDSFLRCGEGCFPRRFVVPLHRATADFDADGDLRPGRVDVAARLLTATLVASQRVRHNAQLWLPFLGGEAPATVCASGGPARGLHPSERDAARRLRLALDGGDDDATARERKGFRLLPGGFVDALAEALALARAPDDGGSAAAPLLILAEGAPPLADVLRGHGPLEDLVVVLGDDVGLSDDEVAAATRLGEAHGGRVLAASLGPVALLASQCITLVHWHLDAIHACPAHLWAPPEQRSRVSNRNRRKKRANAKS